MKNKKKREEKLARKTEKTNAKSREYDAPEEDLPPTTKKAKKDKSETTKEEKSSKRPDIDELKNKFLKKRSKKSAD